MVDKNWERLLKMGEDQERFERETRAEWNAPKNPEREFFTKVKGWELAKTQPDNLKSLLGWYTPPPKNEFQCYEQSIPPISTSWDAFHEWVVPEFYKRFDSDLARMKIGDFFYRGKTPQRALEWAMEELGR